MGFSAEALDATGRMMRCARCGTAWLARLQADDQFAGEGGERLLLTTRRPGRPRFEHVIEHVSPSFGRPPPQPVRPSRWTKPAAPDKPAKAAKPASPAKPSSPVKSAGMAKLTRAWQSLSFSNRALGAWSSAAAAGVLAVIVALLSLGSWGSVGASGHATAQFSGFEIRLLRSAVERVRDGHALSVEGEITNRTNDEIGVPAVRISLRSDGAEVYWWLFEPATTRLAAGRAVQFRSVLASPPVGVDEVAFRLAERQDTVVGMR